MIPYETLDLLFNALGIRAIKDSQVEVAEYRKEGDIQISPRARLSTDTL